MSIYKRLRERVICPVIYIFPLEIWASLELGVFTQIYKHANYTIHIHHIISNLRVEEIKFADILQSTKQSGQPTYLCITVYIYYLTNRPFISGNGKLSSIQIPKPQWELHFYRIFSVCNSKQVAHTSRSRSNFTRFFEQTNLPSKQLYKNG